MNIWKDVDPKRVTPDVFLAYIEISKGMKNKYELDKETGMLFLDRILYTSTHYPQNYGFIPKTLSGDGDPLDVLVMCQEPIVPLALVKAYPIGVIKMIDSEQVDEKIIAIASGDPSLNVYSDLKNLPPHIYEEIVHFFKVYKELEGKKTVIREILGAREARQIIADNIRMYRETYEKEPLE